MSTALNDVRPFTALVYNDKVVGEVGACLTQPYDVISPEEQQAYYKQHPHSYIRLILGSEHADDTDQDNRYTRSLTTLKTWQEADVLQPARPGFWLYQQDYDLEDGNHTTRGLIGVVRLQDLDAGRILPHEKVMKSPVLDRMRLTLETRTQLEPIWSFYQDPKLGVPAVTQKPFIEHRDSATGVLHRVWGLHDDQTCSQLSRAVSAGPIYIADGHHRYQTMLNVRDQMRAEYPDGGPDAPWEFILMYLVNAANEELSVLPYHRLVHSLPSERVDSVLSRLSDRFTVSSIDLGRDEAEARRSVRHLIQDGERFGMLISGASQYHVLHRPRNAGELGVEIFNDLVLKDALGITEEDMVNQTFVQYTHGEADALARVQSGQAQIAFLLDATTVRQIMDRAENGGVMPRKSSFFYPKPLSGMVSYPMSRGD